LREGGESPDCTYILDYTELSLIRHHTGRIAEEPNTKAGRALPSRDAR